MQLIKDERFPKDILTGIYVIESGFNGSSYVGSSGNVEKRLKEHEYLLKNNKHKNKKLQETFNLGPMATNAMPCETRKEAYEVEQKMLDKAFASPNVKTGCMNISTSSTVPKYEITDEIRNKISEASRKRVMSQQHKDILSAVNKGKQYTLGYKFTTEQLEALRNRKHNSGYKLSNEHVTALIESHPGQQVEINGIIYPSYCQAAKALNMDDSLVRYRVLSTKSKYENWKSI